MEVTAGGRLRAVLVTAAVLGIVLAGCGSSAEEGASPDTAPPGQSAADVTVAPTGEPRSGGKVVYGVEGETDGFDPTASRWATAGMTIGLALFDPLMAVDADGVPRPFLAEAVEPDAEATSWTIRLRPDVSFHDGSPVDAEAVVTNIEAHRASLLTSSAMSPVETVTAVDPATVRVDMKVPWAAFGAALTAQIGFVAAPTQLADPEGSRNPVGSGPFEFSSWRTDDRLNVVRNPDYWQAGLPYLDEVEFRPTRDELGRINALVTGQIDVLHTSNAGSIADLRNRAAAGELQLVEDRGEGEEAMVMFNLERPPFDDLRARQAVAHAFDRETFNDLVNDGVTEVAHGPFHPDSKWFVETDALTFDLAEARRLVAEYEAEKGPLAFTYSTAATPELQESAQIAQSMMAEAGMDVTIETFDQPTLISNAVGGEFQATSWRQFGATDPDVDSVWWASTTEDGQDNFLNFANLADDQIDEALRRGRQSSDEAERRAAYGDLQRRMAELVPYVFASHSLWAVAADNDVRGLTNGPLPDGTPSLPLGGMGSLGGTQRLTHMWLER
jgi:ABC-type transport system substrate-binding protein